MRRERCRAFLLLALAALLPFCVQGRTLAGEAHPAAAPKPNVVFILADDLGWSDTGAYGSRFHETPSIDRLAQRGMLFRRIPGSSRARFRPARGPSRWSCA
jgi:hypothetical protein